MCIDNLFWGNLNSSLGAFCVDFENLGRFADAQVQSHAPNFQKTPQLPPQILEFVLNSNAADSSDLWNLYKFGSRFVQRITTEVMAVVLCAVFTQNKRDKT